MAASLRLFDSGFYPSLGFRPDVRRNPGVFRSVSDFSATRREVSKLRSRRCLTVGFRVRCRIQKGDNERSGEEPPESEFTKELTRRGMSPTSLLEEDGELSNKMNIASTDIEKSLSNQRERSMALNSEGLEGLIPRARLLLTTGGTFFIGFWPLILIIVAFFSALYLYFGPSFIHSASKTPISPPPYIDPQALLQDERISQTVHYPNSEEVIEFFYNEPDS